MSDSQYDKDEVLLEEQKLFKISKIITHSPRDDGKYVF